MVRFTPILLVFLLPGCAQPPPKLLAIPAAPLPQGWTRFESQRASIGLPPGWKAFDVKTSGVGPLAELVRKTDPRMADKVAEDLKEGVQNSSITIFGLDEGASPGQGDRLLIAAGPDAPLGMRAFSDIAIGSLLQSLNGAKTLVRHTIRLPIGEAVEYVVSGTSKDSGRKGVPLTVQGYVMLNETEGVMVSLQTNGPTEAKRKLFLQMAQSLRIKP